MPEATTRRARDRPVPTQAPAERGRLGGGTMTVADAPTTRGGGGSPPCAGCARRADRGRIVPSGGATGAAPAPGHGTDRGRGPSHDHDASGGRDGAARRCDGPE